MTPRATSRSTGALAGLLAGATLGVGIAVLESSSLTHIYFDLVSGFFRVASARLPEDVLHRFDTNASVALLPVIGLALFGFALGGLLRRPRTTSIALTLATSVPLALLWRHRALNPLPGVALTIIVGAVSLFVAAAMTRVSASRFAARFQGPALALAFLTTCLVAAVPFARTWRSSTIAPEHIESAPLRRPTGEKVAVIALDGLDSNLLEAAFAEGRLPNLQSIRAGGLQGRLRSIRPPKSPVVWTSAVTGVLPSRHGIRDFVVKRDGVRVPVSGDLRRVPALWDLGLQIGFSTAFVNWYVTWPAEPSRGIMISDRADFDGLDRRVFPELLQSSVDSLRALLPSNPALSPERFMDWGPEYQRWRTSIWGQSRRALSILEDVLRHDAFTLECARLVLSGDQPDLTAVYFRGTDNTQHLFWKYRLARQNPLMANLLYDDLTPDEVRAFAPVVDRYYDHVDAMVGELLSLLEPTTNVLVVSDHGFLTNNERGRWYSANRVLEGLGLAALMPASGGIADSASSVAYSPAPPSTQAVWRIRPGGRARGSDPLADVAARVQALRTTSGDPLVRTLRPGEDSTGVYFDMTFERLSPEGRVRLGDADVPLREIFGVEGHSGDHRMDGILLARGPAVRHGEIKGLARALDLAPTILQLLGVPVAADADGRVLTELFTASWLTEHPIRYVETFGTREAATTGTMTVADEKIREELRALGYIQ